MHFWAQPRRIAVIVKFRFHDLNQQTGVHNPFNRTIVAVETAALIGRQLQTFCGRQRDQSESLRFGEGEGLFQDHMLAGPQCLSGIVEMRIVGGIDDHQLDIRISQEFIQCPAYTHRRVYCPGKVLFPFPYRIKFKSGIDVQERGMEYTPRHTKRTYRRLDRFHIESIYLRGLWRRCHSGYKYNRLSATAARPSGIRGRVFAYCGRKTLHYAPNGPGDSESRDERTCPAGAE